MFWNKTRKIQLIELFYESKKGLYEEIKKKIKSRKYFKENFKENYKFSQLIYLNDLKSFHFYLFIPKKQNSENANIIYFNFS